MEAARKGLMELNILNSKPMTWREIKQACIQAREDFFDNEIDKDKPRTTLSEIVVATNMNMILHIITLENNRIAIYDPESGIYRKDLAFAYKIIHILEPTFSEAKARNVIFMLSAIDRPHLNNGIYSDFKPEYTDKKRYILVKNGIFDKKKKVLKDFSFKFISFSTIGTEYDKYAESPTINGWNVDDWLLDLMSGNEELVNLLWQVISASLNGNYSYRKSIWLLGEGNDGKGTYQQLITNLIGLNNVASLKLNQFSERFALSIIEGKTVIIGDDVQAGVYVDESSNFNSVVTGEAVMVEEKGKPAYNTVFKKTVIQSTNEMPRFKNKSTGTYRRLLIIPFKKTFSVKEDNWLIKDDYIYRTDVLEYVLKKAIEMDFTRFGEPKETQLKLEEFKESNDTVKAFVAEWFDKFQSTRLPTKFLWWLYKEWCKDVGITALNKSKFEKQLAFNIPDGWTKKVSKPGIKFKPSLDIPTGYICFPWDNDSENDKAVTCYVNS